MIAVRVRANNNSFWLGFGLVLGLVFGEELEIMLIFPSFATVWHVLVRTGSVMELFKNQTIFI